MTVHTYNDVDLIACFDKNISESVIKTIAKRQPLRVVFHDDSFADSPSKINVSEIFKMLSPDTRVENVSKDLKKQLPDAKGFSKTNLFYITSFFSLYSLLATDEKTIPQTEEQFTPQVGEQIIVSKKYGITVQDFYYLY